MVVDSTLSFAVRRNVPTRYNRDLVATTLKAMQRVSEIRTRRERVFYKNRMAGNKERERAANRKLVAENQHLLPKEIRQMDREREMETRSLADEMDMTTEDKEVLSSSSLSNQQKIRVKRRVLINGAIEEDMDVDR